MVSMTVPPGVPRWVVWLALAVQVVTYVATAFWWGPGQALLHGAKLADGSLDPYDRQLVMTNWLRVALITAAGALELWIAAKRFGTADHPARGERDVST